MVQVLFEYRLEWQRIDDAVNEYSDDDIDLQGLICLPLLIHIYNVVSIADVISVVSQNLEDLLCVHSHLLPINAEDW